MELHMWFSQGLKYRISKAIFSFQFYLYLSYGFSGVSDHVILISINISSWVIYQKKIFLLGLLSLDSACKQRLEGVPSNRERLFVPAWCFTLMTPPLKVFMVAISPLNYE